MQRSREISVRFRVASERLSFVNYMPLLHHLSAGVEVLPLKIGACHLDFRNFWQRKKMKEVNIFLATTCRPIDASSKFDIVS